MKTFYEDETPDIPFVRVPPPVGYWHIGGEPGLRVPLYRKPSWLTRVLSRWLLQWRWEDRRDEG